jgi:DNA primase
MGKISPVAAKYIVHSNIDIEGVVDRPDVIGAIFGQTEGLLGEDLDLRELQKSGRIGRIEVNTETRTGKTKGTILIPSSLDKAETSIVGAALEIIQRIGPCNAKIEITNIEDVRVSKRSMVIQRAKELLKRMLETSSPDSRELAEEVTSSVRVMEIVEYGRERLPAGPQIDESEEIIIVEGRADVLNLLKNGFKNAIAMNGTSAPATILELSRKKVATVFVDGDRGGNLIIKELTASGEIDFVTKAPDGKEVEELTKKEIHKALRSRVAGEQAKLEMGKEPERLSMDFRRQQRPNFQRPNSRHMQRQTHRHSSPNQSIRQPQISSEEKKVFKTMLEELIGTRGAEILDNKLAVLGKVPISEIKTALKSINNAHAVVFDGSIEIEMVRAAESSNVKCLIGMDSKVRPNETRVNLITVGEL